MKKYQVGLLFGGLVTSFSVGLVYFHLVNKELDLRNRNVSKFQDYYMILNRWLVLKSAGKNLTEYFNNNKYNNIAVYGIGELGKRLIEELIEVGEIQVKYAIDKMSGSDFMGVPVLDCEDSIKNVDAVVVTAVFDFESIKESIEQKINAPVVSLMDIVYAL